MSEDTTAEERDLVDTGGDSISGPAGGNGANGNGVDGHGANGKHGVSRRAFLVTTGGAAAAVASVSTNQLEALADSTCVAGGTGAALGYVFPEFAHFFPAEAFGIANLSDLLDAVHFVGTPYTCGGSSTQNVVLEIPNDKLTNGALPITIHGIPELAFLLGNATGSDNLYLQATIGPPPSGAHAGFTLTFTGSNIGTSTPSSYNQGVPVTIDIDKSVLKPKTVISGPDGSGNYELDDGGTGDCLLRLQPASGGDPQIQVTYDGSHWKVVFLPAAGGTPLAVPSDYSIAPSGNFFEIADSGVMLQIDSVAFNLDFSTAPGTMGVVFSSLPFIAAPTNGSAGRKTTFLKQADGISLTGLGSTGYPLFAPGGLQAEIFAGSAPDHAFSSAPSVTMFDATLSVKNLDIIFNQNALEQVEIKLELNPVPWIGGKLDLDVTIHLNNAFIIALDTSANPAVVSIPHIVEFDFKSFSVEYDTPTNTSKFKTDVKIKPLFKIPTVDAPPDIDLTGLEFDPPNQIKLQDGWIDLHHMLKLKVAGFTMELTKIGFGTKPGDTDQFIGFSGGLSLVKPLPVGASVDGLRIFFNSTGITGVDCKGIELKFTIPGTLSFDGKVELGQHDFGSTTTLTQAITASTSPQAVTVASLTGITPGIQLTINDGANNENVTVSTIDTVAKTFTAVFSNSHNAGVNIDVNFDIISGSISVNVIPLKLGISAKLLICRQPFEAFFIDVAVDLPPPGITLGSSGLAIFGLEGLFAQNMGPKKQADEDWYGDHLAKTGWYWKNPSEDVTDPTKKWKPVAPSPTAGPALAFGVGLTLGTTDNGYTFCMKALLILTLPGPTIIINGTAALLAGRDALGPGKTPPFDALMIFSPQEVLIDVGVHEHFPSDDLQIIAIDADAEVYFDLTDPRNFHLYIGQEPPPKRIRAEVLSLFEADAYFMLTDQWLKLGAHIGFDLEFSFGIGFDAGFLSLSAGLSVKFSALIEGETQLTFRPIQLQGSLHAHAEIDVALYIDIGIHIHISLGFLGSINIDISIHLALGFSLMIDAQVQAEAPKPFYVFAELKASLSVPYLGSISFDVPVSFGDYPPVQLPDLLSVIERDQGTGVMNVQLVPPVNLVLHDSAGKPYTSVKAQTPLGPASDATQIQTAIAAAKANPVPVDWRPVVTFDQDVNYPGPPNPPSAVSGALSLPPMSPVPSTVTLQDYTYQFALNGVWIYEVDDPAGTPLDTSKNVSTNYQGTWISAPGSNQQPGQRAIIIGSNNPLLAVNYAAGDAYTRWLLGAYPYSPCGLPLASGPPSVTVNLKNTLNVKSKHYSHPLCFTGHIGIDGLDFDTLGDRMCWAACPYDQVPAGTFNMLVSGMLTNSSGVPLGGALRITFPLAVSRAIFTFCDIRREQSTRKAYATGWFSATGGGVAQATNLAVSGSHYVLELNSPSGSPGFTVADLALQGLGLETIQYFEASIVNASNEAGSMSSSMTTWTNNETNNWLLSNTPFKPDTVYRIEIETSATVSARGQNSAATNPQTLNTSDPRSPYSGAAGPDIAFFYTGGPPIDDVGVSSGQYVLTPYLEGNLPVPATGSPLPSTSPAQSGWLLPAYGEQHAYLGYAVNAGFNQPWVTAMFSKPNPSAPPPTIPSMQVVLFDANGNPVSSTPMFVGDFNHQNTLSEQTQIDLVDECTGSVTSLPGSTSLSYEPTANLTPNSVYRAELHWVDATNSDHLLYRWAFKTGSFNLFGDMINSFTGAVWPFGAAGVNLATLHGVVTGSASESDKFDQIAALFHLPVTIGTLPAATEVTLVQANTIYGLRRLALMVATPQPFDWTRDTSKGSSTSVPLLTVGYTAATMAERVTRRDLLRGRMRPEIDITSSAVFVRSRDSTRTLILFPSGSGYDVAHGAYTLTWRFIAQTNDPNQPLYSHTVGGIAGTIQDETPVITFTI